MSNIFYYVKSNKQNVCFVCGLMEKTESADVELSQ